MENSNVIFLTSNYSINCKKLESLLIDRGALHSIKTVCVDSKEIRDIITSSTNIKISYLPCIIVIDIDNVIKYESDEAFAFVDEFFPPVIQQDETPTNIGINKNTDNKQVSFNNNVSKIVSTQKETDIRSDNGFEGESSVIDITDNDTEQEDVSFISEKHNQETVNKKDKYVPQSLLKKNELPDINDLEDFSDPSGMSENITKKSKQNNGISQSSIISSAMALQKERESIS